MTLLVFLITGYSRILRAFSISIAKITKINYYIRGVIEYIIRERHKVNSYNRLLSVFIVISFKLVNLNI